MEAVSATSVPEAWLEVLRRIHDNGEDNMTEYGEPSRFTNGMSVEIKNPKAEYHKRDPFCSPNRLEPYCQEFEQNFKNGEHGFKYTYGDRMYDYPSVELVEYKALKPFGVKLAIEKKINQVALIEKALKEKRVESRRLQVITWIPKIDLAESFEDQPCFQGYWIYIRKDGTVDVHARWRSWDCYGAMEANLYALITHLEKVLKPYGYTIRALRIWADNAHYYKRDAEAVEALIK
jgi:thymidylate synthase